MAITKETFRTLIKEGQEVVIKGKVINYKGNTLQYAQGSTIESIE